MCSIQVNFSFWYSQYYNDNVLFYHVPTFHSFQDRLIPYLSFPHFFRPRKHYTSSSDQIVLTLIGLIVRFSYTLFHSLQTTAQYSLQVTALPILSWLVTRAITQHQPYALAIVLTVSSLMKKSPLEVERCFSFGKVFLKAFLSDTPNFYVPPLL